ncbi:MAG: DUF1836 domain-containing protein [Clostridia bacterium]|nr:DUF1836 domain-containing protein [Clostridia bacterium]
MPTLKEIEEYKAPRWENLPDIELYMDQVLVVLDKQLSIFKRDKDEKIITSAMINNYVKQKITLPPVNKKYTRHHLAYLYAVCALKSIMGLSDICMGIGSLLEGRHTAEVFDMFCEELDFALSKAFFDDDTPLPPADTKESRLLRAVTSACANVLYSRYLVETMTAKEQGDGE